MQNAHLKTGILVKPSWLFQYALLFGIAIAISPPIFSSNWVSSSDFHATIEMSSALIAILVGITSIVYFFSLKSTFFLIVGLGYFITGSEDLVHGFLSLERIWTADNVDFSRAIPGTYVTGRLLLGFFVIAAVLFEKTISDPAQQKKQALIFISSSIILSSVMTWVAFLLPLPQFIFPDHLISRPIDFLSAIIFFIAFGLGYKRLLEHRNSFTHFLLLSMLLNAFGQCYMSFSKQLYDIYFDVAHVANILSYFMPVVGLLTYLVEQHKALSLEQEKTQKQKLALVSVIKGTNAGTWEWNIQSGAVIINERSANIIGYTLEEILPLNWRTWLKFFHADDLKKSDELLHKHFSRELEYYECEIRMRHKNGNWVWLLTRGRVSLCDGEGTPLLMSGTYQDITKRKQAEEELIKHQEQLEELVDKRTLALTVSEERYRGIFNQSITAVYVFDNEKNFIDSNLAGLNLLGYSRKELLNMTITDVDAAPNVVITAHKQLLDGGRISNYEHQLVRKDGKVITVLNNSNSMIGVDGAANGMLSTLIDITDFKHLEKQLHQAQKMEAIGMMASGVAHDLNNILAGIVSYPELLLLQLPESSELRSPIEAIQESGKRAATVVADLLTVAKGAASIKEPYDIHILIQEFLESPEWLKIQSLHPKIVCLEKFNAEYSIISCSPVHIKRIVMNLMINAMEAINDVGNIVVSTCSQQIDKPEILDKHDMKPGNYVVLTVQDDGPGIADRDIEHIFEPFYTKKVMGRSGTGLGLAIVWNTMQDHHGKITIKSSERGTCFQLYFPVSVQKEIDQVENLTTEKFTSNNEHILIVDDEPQLREIASLMLQNIGYQVDSVCSGELAIKFVKDNPVDLIVMDMLMEPGINGRQTYEEILKLYPDQKAIVASGFSESNDIKAALELGAGGFIKKPYSLAKLGQAVEEALNS